MTLRRIFFWLHLIAGSLAGVVILIMSLTGVLLMYEKQMIVWADRGFRAAPPASGAKRLPVEELLAKLRATRSAPPATMTLRSDPSEPATVVYGRDSVYLNPYSGEVLGEGSKGIRSFFRVVTDWHRWLGASGEQRAAARAITGASNLAFLFIVLSGIYIWWPRKWLGRTLAAVTLFRGGLRGKARDFNWHNVIGFWCFVPLFLIVLSATVISYPWASNLVYRFTGTEPPPAPANAGRAPRPENEPPRINLVGINELWIRAEREVPAWRSITLRLPGSDRAPVTFTIDEGYAGQPQKRTTLTIDRRGDIVRVETLATANLGRRVRSWLRFVHTGEYYGLAGQTIAGIASASGVVLVWTGVALALRRFRAWLRRKRQVPEPAADNVLVETHQS